MSFGIGIILRFLVCRAIDPGKPPTQGGVTVHRGIRHYYCCIYNTRSSNKSPNECHVSSKNDSYKHTTLSPVTGINANTRTIVYTFPDKSSVHFPTCDGPHNHPTTRHLCNGCYYATENVPIFRFGGRCAFRFLGCLDFNISTAGGEGVSFFFSCTKLTSSGFTLRHPTPE